MVEFINIGDLRDNKIVCITRFRPEIAVDNCIKPHKRFRIVFRNEIKIMDCNIRKPSRTYNHFKWIEEEAERINKDPDRKAYIVENAKCERALAINQ